VFEKEGQGKEVRKCAEHAIAVAARPQEEHHRGDAHLMDPTARGVSERATDRSPRGSNYPRQTGSERTKSRRG